MPTWTSEFPLSHVVLVNLAVVSNNFAMWFHLLLFFLYLFDISQTKSWETGEKKKKHSKYVALVLKPSMPINSS